MTGMESVLVGFAGLGLLWLMIGIATSFSMIKLVSGVDGRPSTSKCQFLMWTATMVFCYLVVYAYRIHMNNFSPIEGWSPNVLLSMGISAATVVAAKAIVSNNVANGSLVKLDPNGKGGIFEDDDGSPDLAKVQLMIWTIIAIGVYLVSVYHNLAAGHRCLPDIDKNLMVLMGLGHSAYIGKKLTEKTPPSGNS